MMNMIGQDTPWGTLDYVQNGTRRIKDPSGRWVDVPAYTANVNLSAEQQAIFDQSQAAQGNMAQIANNQSAIIKDLFSNPFEFTNQDAADWSYDLASSRILPQQQQQDAALRSRLLNSGIREGSAAWNNEMQRLTNANTDQLNQLALTGRQQAFAENLATRNQPMNELNALLTGSQVQNPTASFAQTPQTQVAGVDYTGLVNQQFQAQQQAHQSQMGGLFGLGASLISAFSDERLKEDIRRVGTLDNGLAVYAYRMKGSPVTQIGVLAQEVEMAIPAAIIPDASGFLKVDYAKAVA